MKEKMKPVFTIIAIAITVSCAFTQIAYAQDVSVNGAANAKVLVNLSDFPEWVQDSMSREKKIKKKSKLKIKDLNINEKILGKVKLVEKDEGYRYYTINIGTDSPVECFSLTEFDGPANSLYAIVDNSFESVEELNNKKRTATYSYAMGSGVLSDTPYLLLDTVYVLGEGKDKTLGMLKAMSAETNKGLQTCIHNEIGYRETFFSVFESFVSAFTKGDESPEFFESVIQLKFKDIPVGFTIEEFIVDADGDVSIQSKSSAMFPVDASSIARSDSVSTSWSSADGALINGNHYSIENSTLTSNLSIDHDKNHWLVTGELQGKEVSYKLDYADWLLSNYGSYLATVSLGESDKQSEEYMMWSPDADPSAALKVVISKELNNPDANYATSVGPLKMKFMGDDNGAFIHGVLEQGPVKLDFQNIYQKGQPSLK